MRGHSKNQGPIGTADERPVPPEQGRFVALDTHQQDSAAPAETQGGAVWLRRGVGTGLSHDTLCLDATVTPHPHAKEVRGQRECLFLKQQVPMLLTVYDTLHN